MLYEDTFNIKPNFAHKPVAVFAKILTIQPWGAGLATSATSKGVSLLVDHKRSSVLSGLLDLNRKMECRIP